MENCKNQIVVDHLKSINQRLKKDTLVLNKNMNKQKNYSKINLEIDNIHLKFIIKLIEESSKNGVKLIAPRNITGNL